MLLPTLAIGMVLLSGCKPLDPRLNPSICRTAIPAPLWPDEVVVHHLVEQVPDRQSPVWAYMFEDFKLKCKQERARGKPCRFNP